MHYELETLTLSLLVFPMNPCGLCLQPFLNIYIIFLHLIAVHLFICSHPFAWTMQPSSQPPLKKVTIGTWIYVPAGFVLSVPSHITNTTTMKAKVDLAAPHLRLRPLSRVITTRYISSALSLNVG